MSKDQERAVEVLLAEDNEADMLITQRAFLVNELSVNLHHVWDGEECLSYLKGEGEYRGMPRPDLLLLDLNMPKIDGQEVLEEIVRDPELCSLPVVVLTTSATESDVLKMYQLRCSAYVVKPVETADFYKAIKTIGDHWFSLAVLPSTVSDES